MLTDPIADMLTRIRNALGARKQRVVVPASRMKRNIAQILKEEGYIGDYRDMNDRDTGHPGIEIKLKYDAQNKPVIEHLARFSRPGLRKYLRHGNIPKVRQGLGMLILSTSKGLMSDTAAREAGIGGEAICTVY